MASYGVLWLTPAAEEMKEADWNFPEGRFLAYVLGPMEQGQPPIFIVLNAAPEEIAFKLPQMPEYKNWQQVLNTTEAAQTPPLDSRPAPRPARRRGRCWPLRAQHERPAIRPESGKLTARGFGCGRRRRTASMSCWSSRTR